MTKKLSSCSLHQGCIKSLSGWGLKVILCSAISGERRHETECGEKRRLNVEFLGTNITHPLQIGPPRFTVFYNNLTP